MRRTAGLVAVIALAASWGWFTPAAAQRPSADARISTSSTVVPSKLAAKVLVDYRAFGCALFAAGDPPNPNDPKLAEHATGSALTDAVQVLTGDAVGGQVRRGSQVLSPAVLAVSGTAATVRDCYRNNWLAYAASNNSRGVAAGKRLEEPAGPKLRMVSMTFDGSDWKVSAVQPAVPQQRSCGSVRDEQRVIDATRQYEQIMYEVFTAKPPNPNDPRLKKVVARTNGALAQVQSTIRSDLAQGVVNRRASPTSIAAGTPTVVAFNVGKSATGQACFIDDGSVMDRNGTVLSPPGTTPTSWTYQLVVENRSWKVAAVTKGGPCTLG